MELYSAKRLLIDAERERASASTEIQRCRAVQFTIRIVQVSHIQRTLTGRILTSGSREYLCACTLPSTGDAIDRSITYFVFFFFGVTNNPATDSPRTRCS